MYKISKLKYTEKSCCAACLSNDRKLTRISKLIEYTDILLSITKNAIQMSPKLFLCWECVAVLRKIKLFQLRVENAQRTLAQHSSQKQALTIKSLSRLSTATTDNVIAITYEDNDDDEKPNLVTIKQEVCSSEDDCTFDQENTPSDHCLTEIKKEDKPQIKCTKRKKISHYKVVYAPNVYKKRSLRKKFAITYEEIGEWLEQERDSIFYKSFKFRCEMCLHGFNCNEKLQKHCTKYHDPSLGSHLCPVCGLRLPTPEAVSVHSRTHLTARECVRCGFTCYTARRLDAHIDTHRMLQCSYCGLCVNDSRAYLQHFKSSHRTFECDHCGKKCKTKYMLEKHITCHMMQHKCESCGRTYASRASLAKHRAVKHALGRPEDAYCVRCDKQFDSAAVYRRHVASASAHLEETNSVVKKSVSCPECGNTYSRRSYMMNHFRHVHMNQSKHYCDTCDRHFLNRTRYVDHMRFNHEGVKKEKNKLCNVCGKGFATNRILLNHIRTHSGERPYACEYCGARFTQKHSATSHVRHVHLNTRRATVNNVRQQ